MIPTSEQWYAMGKQEQFAWARQATGTERLQLAGVLTWDAQQQVWQKLRDSHPEASEVKLKVLYVRRQYGDDLAERIRPNLERRAQAASREG